MGWREEVAELRARVNELDKTLSRPTHFSDGGGPTPFEGSVPYLLRQNERLRERMTVQDGKIAALESRLAALEAKGEGEGQIETGDCVIERTGIDGFKITGPNGRSRLHEWAIGDTIVVQDVLK